MSQIAKVKLSDVEWQSLESLIAVQVSGFTFDDTKNYYIECQTIPNSKELTSALINESSSTPTTNSGVMLVSNSPKLAIYKVDSPNVLYVKALKGLHDCYLNVTVGD